ncbi:MAG: glycosyltransferase [Bacilli bacterium]
MKISFLQYWYDYFGGIETVNGSLATQFSKDGYDVTVLCLWRMGKGELIKEQNYKKIYINDQHKRPSYKKMVNNLCHLKIKNVFYDIKKLIISKKITNSDYKNFSLEIQKINPDYIIVSSYELLRFIPKIYLKKCYLHMHNGFSYYFNNDIKYNNKKVSNVLFEYSNKINKFIWLTPNFMKCAIEKDLDNSTYMFNPVRISTNKTSPLDEKKVVFIGRLSKEKGIDRLIDIFNKRDPKYKDWKLLIYGSGDTSNLKFDNSVKEMGTVSNVGDALKDASIFALTSYREGFPMVILEAYEYGIPVIAYDFEVSSSEIIVDGETGYIIQQGNKEEYIKKLNELMGNKELRLKMGKNAKDFVKKFQKEEVVKRWYELFKGEL